MAVRKKRRSLKFSIMLASVIPVIIVGIMLTAYAQSSVREGMSYEVEQSLSGMAHNLINMYDQMNSKDFTYEEGRVMKGDRDLTYDFRLMDSFKKDTGVDVTICIGARRCLTTIRDKNGERLIGSNVPEEVQEAVLRHGDDYFSQNIDINGVAYYGYYVPIRDIRGNVIGTSFAGKAVEVINSSVRRIIWRNIILCGLVILIVCVSCNIFSYNMARAVRSIKSFLDGLAQGDFSQVMPQNVSKRHDELAEIGEDAIIVSKSLENLVNRDPLTGLLNRRACMIRAEKRQSGEAYAIAIGDIDFFKKVNDQYGHKKGDDVLCFVSDVMQRGIGESGFVSRWGGEEFLLVMEGESSVLYEKLCRISDEIRENVFEHSGKEFQITMTFGLVKWEDAEKFEIAVNRADELLYFGKEHGRNQIVVQKPPGGAE